jgi:hypothetical protein
MPEALVADQRPSYAFDPLRPDDPNRRFHLRIGDGERQMLPGLGRLAVITDEAGKAYLIRGIRTDGTDDHAILGRVVPIDEPALCEG